MSILKYAIIVVGMSVAGSAAYAQITNTIPYADSFEHYAPGTVLAATNGWSGNGVVTNLAYTYNSASNGFPVAGTHTHVLGVSGGATNDIDGASSSVVWVDSILNAETRWSGPGHPSVDTNANACIYVNTNGSLVAGHTQYGASNLTWSVFADVTISSNAWNRIALQLNYSTHYYSIMLNGVALEHANGRSMPNGSGAGGAWFPMIGNFPFAAIAVEGDAHIDDLVVSDEAPYASISVVDAGTVAEGDAGTTLASFVISLSSNTPVPVTFDYATSDGSASAGVDYIANSGTLTIPAGASQASIDVGIIGDTDTESDVDFSLNISSPVNGLIANASGSATITDDDIVVSADLMVSGSSSKINDGAPSKASNPGVTNYFSTAGTIDWVVWNSTAITPSERKSAGSAFGGFTSTNSWSSGSGNRVFIAWEDGTVLPSATNFNALAMTDVGYNVPYTAMEFSVDLKAVTEGSHYKLKLYMTDKRNNSSIEYWDASSGAYATVSFESDNDAGDLRIHEVIISNVTVDAALPLQITGMRNNSGSAFPVALGGMELILVGSLLPPPAEGGYDGWTGDYDLFGSNALLSADASVVASFNEGYDGVTGSTGAGVVTGNLTFGGLSGSQSNSSSQVSWDGREYALATAANTGVYQGDYDLHLGDSVYGDLVTVADNRANRYRIRDANPDVLQLLTQSGNSLGRAGLMVLDGNDTVLGDINQMTAQFAATFQVSVVVEVGGQLYITSNSRLRSGSGVENYALDLENETWQVYAPGVLTDDGSTDYNLDFRFSAAKGSVFGLSSSDVVTKVGLAYDSEAVGQGWSTNKLVFDTVPEPATIGMFAAMSGALLWIRRRFTA